METKLNSLKIDILKMSYKAQEGHVASAFSILDILWVLYKNVMFDSRGEERGTFVLSKGHASLALYSILREKGYLEQETMNHFAEYNSILGGHPKRNPEKGIVASTGSLGHGLPIAAGMALGNKIQNNDLHVFVLVGDGEMNEGSMWESIALAGHHKLSNLTCIVDYNHSTDRALNMGDLCEKFHNFGWDAETINGHDHAAIRQALSLDCVGNRPRAVIAETIKGYGCKEMENNPAWHHKFPTEEELSRLVLELEHMEV